MIKIICARSWATCCSRSIFHAEIAAEADPGFDVEDVARGIADKLVARHPYVFATAEVPGDLHFTWEQRKAVEKGRTSVAAGDPRTAARRWPLCTT